MAQKKLSLPEGLHSGNDIRYWASRYPKFECDKDDWIRDRVQTAYKDSGHLDYEDLRCLGIWKNGNERNSKYFCDKFNERIKRKTREAYQLTSIFPLLRLRGLQYPTASSLMHFAYPDKFPIIDRRALATLLMRPVESKEIYIGKQLWEDYCEFCRDQAQRHDVCLRELDRALWQFDAENSFWQKHDPNRSPAARASVRKSTLQ